MCKYDGSMVKTLTPLIIPSERIENKIYLIRAKKVMVDSDLAELYGVETKVLNQAVKRNITRFPKDFMFQLSNKETGSLRSQIVTLKSGRGEHRKYAPVVFTEQGIAMLSSILNSERAVQVNIFIIRVFTRLRELLASHKELRDKVDEHDKQLKVVFETLRKLLTPPEEPPKRRIGFGVE
jgi:phage regulator Rha-like protein